MRRLLFLFVFVIALPLQAQQDRVVLDTPVLAQQGVTTFRLWALSLRRASTDAPHFTRDARIEATLRTVDANGAFTQFEKRLMCTYEGAEAEALIIALNRADLSTASLERRVIQRCMSDGKLGTGTFR